MIRIPVIALSVLVGCIVASYNTGETYQIHGSEAMTAQEMTNMIDRFLEEGRARRREALQTLGEFDRWILNNSPGLGHQKLQTRGNCLDHDFGIGCGRSSRLGDALTRLFAERKARQQQRRDQRREHHDDRRTFNPHRVHPTTTTTEESKHYTIEYTTKPVEYTPEPVHYTPEPVHYTREPEMETEAFEGDGDEEPEENKGGKLVCPGWVITHKSPCCKGWSRVERECSSEVPDYCPDSCVGKPKSYEKCESDTVYKTSCSPIYSQNTLEREPEDNEGATNNTKY